MSIFKDTVEIYEDSRRHWRWSLRNQNGHVTADGSEGYASESNAKRAARAAGRSLAVAKIKTVRRPASRAGGL